MRRTNRETEKKVIESYREGNTLKEVGKQYGLHPVTVHGILKRNGVERRDNGLHLPEEEIVKEYQTGVSSGVIARKYGANIHTITNLLARHGIKRDNRYHNLTLDLDYWENIDEYHKAYFLGFMITDGNVYRNAIRIQLKSEDRHILETFSEKTKNSNNICVSKSRDLVYAGAKSKKWVEDLSKYGVVPRKTYNSYIPDISEDMMPHLLRGVFDGDGWVTYKAHAIGICGSERLVTQVRDYLSEKLGVYHVKVTKCGEHLWEAIWSSNKDIKTIGEYLYKDKQDCYLRRKYDNYLRIIHANTEVSSEIAKGSETP